MNLIGITVKHSSFGSGVITEQTDNHVIVKFTTKTAKFIYPDAFERFLYVEDENIHVMVTSAIEKSKAAQRQAKEITSIVAKGQPYTAVSATPSKTKKPKAIDEMFSADYHVEKMARQPIFTYQQVEDQFGINIHGFGKGINPTDTAIILISSIGKSHGKFVYHDRWTTGGDYLYSGEGKTGDQVMNKGNLAIRNATLDGKKIHLFIKFSPQEYYYQGIFELVDYTYEDEKDENGNSRKEYKFRLRKIYGE